MVKNFYSVLIAALAALLLAYCPKPTDSKPTDSKPTDPVTIYSPTIYTISFDKNHGGAGGVQADLPVKIQGTSVTLPAATFTPPAGMRFMGWAETPRGAVIQGAYTGPDTYSSTVTLYAVWGGNPYTINFDKNHAEAEGSQADLADQIWGTFITLPAAAAFTPPEGMSFAGWAETPRGAVIQGAYRGPDSYSAAVTLYAVWEDNPYTINFDKNHAGAGGSQRSLADQIWGASVTLPATTTFTPPSDMRFVGWAETRTGAVIQGAYRGPDSYSAAVTLYAVWNIGNARWRSIASSSDGSKLAAVVGGENGGSIYTSVDSGAAWTHRTAAGSRNWRSIASSSDGSKLAAVVYGGGIYTSADSGATWTYRGAAGSRNWRSIASSSDGSKLAAVVDYGSVYTSDDSGVSWADRSAAGGDPDITGSKNWYSIASSSDGTKLAAVVHLGDVYTSDDSGLTWRVRSPTSGRRRLSWYSIASSSDGTKLAAAVYSYIRGGIYTSADSGATWTHRSAAGSRDWMSIASSSDGTKLAAVAWGGGVYTSADSGATWTRRSAAGNRRRWESIASSSDGSKLAAVVWVGGVYTSADSGATWMNRSE